MTGEELTTASPGGRGRTRDTRIDADVLAVASRHLAARGFDAMSLTAIAEEAGTTRQAVYRRWPTKSALASAAMTAMEDHPAPARPAMLDDPFADLVAELTDFERGVSRPGRMSLVGTMLQDSTDPDALARYRERVVTPRRRRLKTMLIRAQKAGLIDSHADLEVGLTMLTGSWYGRALSGARPPAQWPRRTAALVWRALGGTPPD